MLEYMRHIDDAKKRAILSQLENPGPVRIALKQIDDNVFALGNSKQNQGGEGGEHGSS